MDAEHSVTPSSIPTPDNEVNPSSPDATTSSGVTKAEKRLTPPQTSISTEQEVPVDNPKHLSKKRKRLATQNRQSLFNTSPAFKESTTQVSSQRRYRPKTQGIGHQVAMVLLMLGMLLIAANEVLAETHGNSRSIIPSGPIYRQNASAMNIKADGLMREGRLLEAIGLYRQAIQQNPNSSYTATLYNNLGLAYEQAGLYDLAVASFQHAQRLQPDFMPYYTNLVLTWKNADQLDQVISDLKAHLAMNPKDDKAWLLLGWSHTELDNPEEGFEAWEEFMRLAPRSNLREPICFQLPRCELDALKR